MFLLPSGPPVSQFMRETHFSCRDKLLCKTQCITCKLLCSNLGCISCRLFQKPSTSGMNYCRNSVHQMWTIVFKTQYIPCKQFSKHIRNELLSKLRTTDFYYFENSVHLMLTKIVQSQAQYIQFKLLCKTQYIIYTIVQNSIHL